MFTGIVEEMGTVVSLTKAGDVVLWDGSVGEGWILVLQASVVLQGAYDGCSIAVNGTCLTVTKFDATTFTVGCAPETMRRTNLIDLKAGDRVNLERSMAASDRNSGHFVQGHVDETGTIQSFWREGDSLWVRIQVTPSLIRYIVPKGYIAVDGTSLTVCDVDNTAYTFTFMLIEYTQKHIIVPLKKEGDRVNLEVDVLGKYVDKSVGGFLAAIEGLGAKLEAAVGKLSARLDVLEAKVNNTNTSSSSSSSTSTG